MAKTMVKYINYLLLLIFLVFLMLNVLLDIILIGSKTRITSGYRLGTFTHINHAFAWPNMNGDIIAPVIHFLVIPQQVIYTIKIGNLFFL